MVWSGFLYGTVAYWFWIAKSVLAAKEVSPFPASTTHSLAQPATSGFGALLIPGSWAFPLGIALRVIGIAYLLVLTYLLVTHIKKHLQLKWVRALPVNRRRRSWQRFSRFRRALL